MTELAPPVRLTTPLSRKDVARLRAGDRVLLTGVIYTARDAAHQRLVAALERGDGLPFDPEGQVIYYVGPAPPRPGRAVGAAGPTSSYRMDPYAEALMAQGIRAMIGKGQRGPEVIEALQRHGAVYLAATGGAGALIAAVIKESRIIAYPDLGPEAIRELRVEDFPAIVANDTQGGDAYTQGLARFAREG